MSGIAQRRRQRVIDGYLAQSGRNLFVAAEFLDWLSERPDHEAYKVFFSQTDEQAARAHRIDLVRNWVSGLRISVKVEPVPDQAHVVQVVQLPAYTSPEATRQHGGGYRATDASDPASVADMVSQAQNDLRRWYKRWGGVLTLAGYDTAAIQLLIADADGSQIAA